MVRCFKIDPQTGAAAGIGIAEAEKLGCENAECDPKRPFVVTADGRLGAEGIGAEWVAQRSGNDPHAHEFHDHPVLSIGKSTCTTRKDLGKSWFFVQKTGERVQQPVSQREKDLRDIEQLYGTDTPQGREMLLRVVFKHVLVLLPDDAIHELAEMHRQAEQPSPHVI